MATGSYFGDMNNPQIFVRVGNKGDVGTMEIVEMLFTVKGSTAGAITIEWNVYADAPGSAGIWDSHVRVGGANGSDLAYADYPIGSSNQKCQAASLMFHVTTQASGYFETCGHGLQISKFKSYVELPDLSSEPDLLWDCISY
jgi:hypothetical protein